MNNILIRRKKRIIITLIVGILILGGSFALVQTIFESVTNTFSSVGKVNVGVVEDNGTYETGDANEIEGETLGKISTDSSNPTDKNVSIINIDRQDYPTANTYVRVRLVPSFVYDDGNHEGETVATDIKIATVSDPNGVHYNFVNNNMWTAVPNNNGETYYYYKNILAPGATTEKLLDSVYYQGNIPEGTHFELEVLVEGIQANSTGDKLYKSAMEAWGLTDDEADRVFTNNITKKIENN